MMMMKDTNSKTRKDESAAIIANLLGVTPDLVRKVLRGDREGHSKRQIKALYKYYQNGKKQLIKEMQQMAKELIKESR
jgi:predicted transcriptional regulator